MSIRRSGINLSLIVLLLVLGSRPVAASNSGDWTPPENLSGQQGGLDTCRLEAGADGTLALVWPGIPPSASQHHLYARVREPGAPWGPHEDLSAQVMVSPFNGDTRYWAAQVAPDGTVWVAWSEIDSGQSGDNRRVMAAHRSPGGTWQTDWVSLQPPGSGYETEIRFTDLAVGPEGDVVVAWVACTTGPMTPSQGPCTLKVRRRPPGASDWNLNPLDVSSSQGIDRAYVQVGLGGLTVVVWAGAKSANSSEWAVRAATLASRSAAWQVDNDVSDGWFVLHSWPVRPVIGEDGMTVTAWTAMSQAPTPLCTHYSVTWNRSGGWGTPAQISLPSLYVLAPRLSFRGGVTVAAWEQLNSSGQWAIYGNARDAGGTWDPLAEEQISPTALSNAQIYDLEQWPGGTAVVLWTASDSTRAADADSALLWSGRPPGGSWGGAGEGQFGGWRPLVYGGGLALQEDGSGVVLWATEDSSRPTNERGILLASRWPPGGPSWSPPEVVDEGRGHVWLYDTGVAAVPGRSTAAAWGVLYQPGSNDAAIFFSELTNRVYLPLMLRNVP